jgi:hypothetical protein
MKSEQFWRGLDPDTWKADEARKEAGKILTQVDAGQDPANFLVIKVYP